MSICSIADITTYLGINATATDAQRGLITMLIPLAEDSLKDYVGYSIEQATYTHFLPSGDLFSSDPKEVDVVNDRVVVSGWSDTRILQLPELPVRSITSIYEDAAAEFGQGPGDFNASTLLTSGVDYALELDQTGICRTGHVRRVGSVWPAKAGTVKVTYVAGYTPEELDGTATAGIRAQALKMAAILTVVKALTTAGTWGSSSTGNTGPLASESITTSGHSVSYATDAVSGVTGFQVSLSDEAKALAQPFRRFRR